MLFILFLIAVVVFASIVGARSSRYDRVDNVGLTLFVAMALGFVGVFIPTVSIASGVGNSTGDAQTYNLIETDGYYLAAGYYDNNERAYNFLREDGSAAFVGDSTSAAKAIISETSGTATVTYTNTYTSIWWYLPWLISGQSVTSFEVPADGVLETSK